MSCQKLRAFEDVMDHASKEREEKALKLEDEVGSVLNQLVEKKTQRKKAIKMNQFTFSQMRKIGAVGKDKVFTTYLCFDTESRPKKPSSHPETLLKKRLWHQCLPVNFAKFLKSPFLQNAWWLLLSVKIDFDQG